MRVRYSTTHRFRFCDLDDEPDPLTGESDVWGSLHNEDHGDCFVLWIDGSFESVPISACKPIDPA